MKFLCPARMMLAAALCAGFGRGVRAGEPAATVPATSATTVPALAASPTVATVNGKTLSVADLNQETRTLESQYARQIPPEQMQQYLPQIRQQAMQNMVNKQLLLQDADDRKIAVSDDEVKTAIDAYSKSIPPGQTLEALLARAGIALKDFNQQTIDSLRLKKMLDGDLKDVTVSDDEASKFYTEHPEQFKTEETVSARHILVMFAPGDDATKKAEKKKRIDAIRDRLLKGEDFAKVCAETSEDPGSKNNGGLYEDFGRGKMVPPFETAAFTQKVGEIGPVVETSFGYHVIKVEKHTQAGLTPLPEVKDRLKTFLENRKKQELVQKLLGALRDRAKITYSADGGAPATQPAAK